MTDKQTKIWHEAQNETRQLVDGLGNAVDFNIVDPVAILRLMGFATTMSCGGHEDRITGGPYIVFTSQQTVSYLKQRDQLADIHHFDHKQLTNLAQVHNLVERKRMLEYLITFYKSRKVPYGQRLTIIRAGLSRSRLQCESVDLAPIVGEATRREMLEAHRTEMLSFTDHLKRIFFSEKEARARPVAPEEPEPAT